MNKLLIFLTIFSYSIAFSQTKTSEKSDEKGFLFNCSIGFSNLLIAESNSISYQAGLSLPNLSVGYRMNSKWALFLHLPSSTYKLAGKTRGFEGILVGSQFWLKEHWWMKGAIGLCLDAPAFWTVDNPKTADFRFGFPEIMLSTGYEFYKGKKLNIDAYYKCYFGGTHLNTTDSRFGISNSIGIGFNWY